MRVFKNLCSQRKEELNGLLLVPLIKAYSKPSSLFPNCLAAGPGLRTENWLHRSNAGADTDPTWRICFGREGQELQMFHGRESHRDEEFIKLLQGGGLSYFPDEKSMLVPVPGARNLPFLMVNSGRSP